MTTAYSHSLSLRHSFVNFVTRVAVLAGNLRQKAQMRQISRGNSELTIVTIASPGNPHDGTSATSRVSIIEYAPTMSSGSSATNSCRRRTMF